MKEPSEADGTKPAQRSKPHVASRKQDGHDEQDEQDEHDRQDDSRARSEASEGFLFEPHGGAKPPSEVSTTFRPRC